MKKPFNDKSGLLENEITRVRVMHAMSDLGISSEVFDLMRFGADKLKDANISAWTNEKHPHLALQAILYYAHVDITLIDDNTSQDIRKDRIVFDQEKRPESGSEAFNRKLHAAMAQQIVDYMEDHHFTLGNKRAVKFEFTKLMPICTGIGITPQISGTPPLPGTEPK